MLVQANKDKKHHVYPAEFAISIFFDDPDDGCVLCHLALDITTLTIMH